MPEETTRLVIGRDGQPISILAAIQEKEIPVDEAWIVCASWPGMGWHYDSDRFLWERSLPVHVLADLARAYTGAELVNDPGDERLAARMATAISHLSSSIFGIDIVISMGRDMEVEEGWASTLATSRLFPAAAKETAEALSSDESDPLGSYASRWLHPTSFENAKLAVAEL
jgi:hypothetical protein